MSSVNATGVKSTLLMPETSGSGSVETSAQRLEVSATQSATSSDSVTISDEARKLLESTSVQQTEDTGIEPPKVQTLDTGIEPPRVSTRDTGIEPPK